jgi:hypothetical protein
MTDADEWLKTADIDRLQDAEARAIKAEAALREMAGMYTHWLVCAIRHAEDYPRLPGQAGGEMSNVDAESLAQIAYAARFPDTGTRYGEMPWDRLPEDAKNKWRRVAIAVGLLLGNERRLRLKAEEDAAQLNLTFDLQWEADQRAIKAWQAAHPERPNVWPDRCDMVVWLMEHYAQSEARALKAEEECRLLGIAQFEANAARLKAEAALREVANLYDNMGWSPDELPTHMGRIARAALEPPP